MVESSSSSLWASLKDSAAGRPTMTNGRRSEPKARAQRATRQTRALAGSVTARRAGANLPPNESENENGGLLVLVLVLAAGDAIRAPRVTREEPTWRIRSAKAGVVSAARRAASRLAAPQPP